MNARIIVAATLTAALTLIPTTASAKGGAKDVTVSGPGLATPIRLGNNSGDALTANELAQRSGFFLQPADRLTANPPQKGDLGPRYVATYRLLVGPNETASKRQELYPFAEAGAVTYMQPGQRAFDATSRGGWYRAGAELTLLLVGAGVPVPPSYEPPVPVVAPPRLTG